MIRPEAECYTHKLQRRMLIVSILVGRAAECQSSLLQMKTHRVSELRRSIALGDYGSTGHTKIYRLNLEPINFLISISQIPENHVKLYFGTSSVFL
jgi:hypothetical protein